MQLNKNVVSTIKQKLNSLKKNDSLIFSIFTDLHISSSEDEAVDKLCEVLSDASKEMPFETVINLGDNFASRLGRLTHKSNDELFSIANSLFDKIEASANCPVTFVGGNHDGLGADFFTPEFWNSLTKERSGNSLATYDEVGSHFYVDYEKSNTRLVFLQIPSDSDLASEKPCPIWEFGKRQLHWLENVALSTNSYVIVIVHVPFFHHYFGNPEATIPVWDGEKVREPYINDLCGTIKDRDEVVDIIKQFSDQNPGKLVAIFSGHTHRDSAIEAYGEDNEGKNPLPCPMIIPKMFFTPNGEDKDPSIAFDIVIFTPSEKTLDILRLGEGEDRHFTF